MKICVVHPSVTKESAGKLAEILKADTWNPYKTNRYKDYDVLFNYGCSDFYVFRYDKVINSPEAVRISTDKIKTYEALKKGGVPTCEYVTKKNQIPASWKWVVNRATVTGRNCEGVLITVREEALDNQPLYTKFFHHTEEHRIVVFKGEIVGRYMKTNLNEGEYELTAMLPDGYGALDRSAVAACRAVGLDYAGVDILCTRGGARHIVLEVNSGPLLTEEAQEFFVNKFKNLKGI